MMAHHRSAGWITLTAFLLCLISVSGTPPPASAGNCGVLLDIIFFGITAITDACKPFTVESAPPVAASCTTPVQSGTPQFLKTPKGSAKYPFGGSCTRQDQPGVSLKYRWEGSWTPAETDPNKPNASESVEITGYEPFIPNRAPGGKIYLNWTARCNYDPWLRPETSGGCRRLGEFIPPDLRDTVPDLTGQGFPQTRNVIPAAERQRLAAAYLLANPLVHGGATFPSQAGGIPSAFPTAPTINSPAKDGIIVKGKGVFKITPSKYLTGTHAQYQLRWLNPPASYRGKGLDFYNQELPMNLIASPAGLPVPETLLAQGTWEIRVRINQPKVGDWSDWVRFTYYLQHPASGTTAQDAQTQDFQFGASGQQKTMSGNSGTKLFRPQTTPQQGLGAGTGLIRPRGLDDTGGKESNETVDTTPETEKKP